MTHPSYVDQRPRRTPVPVQSYPTTRANRERLTGSLEHDLDQDQLAREGKAKGQCTDCGAYRWDGGKPTWHVRGCAYGDRD